MMLHEMSEVWIVIALVLAIVLIVIYRKYSDNLKKWEEKYDAERDYRDEKIELLRKEMSHQYETNRKDMETKHENDRVLWSELRDGLRKDMEIKHENDKKEWDERHEQIRRDLEIEYGEDRKIWHLTFTEMQKKTTEKHEDERQALEEKYEGQKEELKGMIKKKDSKTLTLGDSRARGALNQILGTFALINEYDHVFFLSSIIGSGPVDLFGVKNDSLDFIEIKIKGAKLSKKENMIKKLVTEKKVNYRIMDGNIPKTFEIIDRDLLEDAKPIDNEHTTLEPTR